MADELKVRFGSLVAAHRKRKGFTQPQLAEAAGISKDMLARLEIGKSGARFVTVQKLADALGVDPAELFTPHMQRSSPNRPILSAIMLRLAKMSDSDLEWLNSVLDSVLVRRK